MSQLFSPTTALETLIHRGDFAGTLDHLRVLSVAERQQHRASVVRMIRLMWESGWAKSNDKGLIWGTRSTPEQDRAAAAAVLLCGTADDAAQARLHADDVIALAREFDLPCVPILAEALMQRAPHCIRLVQELIAAGIVMRPDSEAYTIGLISLPRTRGRDTSLADYFIADPGLNDAVLRMFDIQGTAEDCLASADKYTSAANSWSTQLLSMCRSGVLARATLLAKSLGALEQDWPQYRAGWFSRFHQSLAPTVAELQVNLSRYLQLCHSRIPPTVSLALDALSQLEAASRVEPDALIEALRPVFATGSKGQVEIALKLMQRCLARAPALGVDAAVIACAALVHETPALQAKLLKQLTPHASDDRVRAELQRHLPGIAASNRNTILALIGDVEPPAQSTVVHSQPDGGREPVSAASPERRIAPVSDYDELVRLIAYVFENDTDIDAFERALGALVAATPICAADLPRFGPVLKRVPKLRKPLAIELGRLLVFACHGQRLSSTPSGDGWGKPSRVHMQLIARIDELMDLASQNAHVLPLSSPTHLRGVISVADLASRLHAHRQMNAETSMSEQVLAILRLDPACTDADLQRLRAMPDEPFVRALRYALGEDIDPGAQRELFCAAARIRHPQSDDVALQRIFGDPGPDGPLAARYTWEVNSWSSGDKTIYWHHELIVHAAGQSPGTSELLAVARHPPPPVKPQWSSETSQFLAGEDPALVAYSATMLPSDLEAFFAEGAREIGNNLDWYEARWHNKAYLQPLLDATVQPGPMAHLLLACALGGREPGQTAVAIDCLVRMYRDSRLDIALLAATLGRLLTTPLVKAARYRKSIDAALRIDPALAGSIIELLVPALIATAESPPKDAARLLELLHELLLVSGQRLDEAQRAGLVAMNLGGSGKSVRTKLLALVSHEGR